MQELTDYEIVDEKSTKKLKKKEKKQEGCVTSEKRKKSASSDEHISVSSAEDTIVNDSVQRTMLKKSRKPLKQKPQQSQQDDEEPAVAVKQTKALKRKADDSTSAEHEIKKKKRKKNRGRKRNPNTNASPIIQCAEVLAQNTNDLNEEVVKHVTENDLPGWKGMFVPSMVLRALKENGFAAPTSIQALTLPSAIRDRKDIVGAAETGSGKTLAFGIPLIHHILARKSLQQPSDANKRISDAEEAGGDLMPDEDVDDDNDIEDEEDEEDEDDNDDDEGEKDEDDLEEEEVATSAVDDTINDDDELDQVGDSDLSDDDDAEVEPRETVHETGRAPDIRPLYALILTPTRELAIQVRDHILSVAKYAKINVVAIVGGISMDKQRRLLRKQPEIVVATPGRLWDLMQEGRGHLAQVPNVPFLVIDEADRMIEKGHFQELSAILELMNSDDRVRRLRQTFVFSATLTFVHVAPHRFKKKKRLTTLTTSDKLETLMAKIGIKEKPKVVDLTRKAGTAETLTETKILCSLADKDVYLYYFLHQFPGRTLIFTNSKDCLRRLLSLLTLLECKPLPLHADMHQKQRLKNLERFTASPTAVLLATDVAARGLDIPNVQHVIHFQVPSTTENYIHRSGRTARATKQGLSFLIVGPDDLKNYRKILRSLNRQEDIPNLPVELKYLSGIKERIQLAKSIDAEEHHKMRLHNQNNWFTKAAKEMDIELDEDLLHDEGSSRETAQYKSRMKRLRSELKTLLRTPVQSQGNSFKYPTMTGKLVVPYMQVDEALDRVKSTKPLKAQMAVLPNVSKKTKRRNRKKKL